MKKRIGIMLSFLLLALGAGCSETSTAPRGADPTPASAALVAVPSTGRVHFLPPLVAASEAAGPFDTALAPVVQVCAWTGSWSEGACDAPVATFTMQGQGAQRVRVVDDGYIANWNTNTAGIDAGAVHRIRVLLGDDVEGHVDVVFARSAADDGQYPTVAPRSTVPVRFRIERREAGGIQVGADGGDFVLLDEAVRLQFPAGALADPVLVTVTPLDDAALPSNPAPVRGTAFAFGPSPLSFQQPVTLTLAFDPVQLPEGYTADDVLIYHMPTPGSIPAALPVSGRTSTTVSALIGGFSYYFVSVPMLPVLTWRGGAPGAERDWGNAANWDAGRVPASEDIAVIPATTHRPQLLSGRVVRSIVVEPGAALDLQNYPLTVHGSVDATGGITGTGTVVILDAASSTTLRGTLPAVTVASGPVTLSGPVTVAGNVTLSGVDVSLDLAGFAMRVEGNFTTQGSSGRLVMNPGSSLDVGGTLRFSASGPSSQLSGGVLTLRGSFVQSAAPAAVVGEAAHRLVLAGTTGAQSVRMDHAGTSSVGEVLLSNGAGIALSTNLAIRGGLSYADAAVGAPVSGPASTVRARDYALFRGPVTLDTLRVGAGVNQVGGYGYDVGTTVFTDGSPLGSIQYLGEVRYRDVVLDGATMQVGAPLVTVGGNLTVRRGRLGFTSGQQRTLVVGGDLLVEGTSSYLSMTQAADRMVVHGNTTFRGRTLSNGMSAGRLWVGGNFTQGNGANAFQATGSHTTVLFGSAEQRVQFADVDNWFATLALTNIGGGVRFATSARTRSRIDLVGRTVLSGGVIVSNDTVVYRSTSHTRAEAGSPGQMTAITCAGAIVLEEGADIDGVGWDMGIGVCKLLTQTSPANYDLPPLGINVQITSPAQNAVFTHGQSVTFTGSATDVTGSPLTGSALTWQSGVQGVIGTGTSLTTSSLQPGTHLIRLLATGSDGTIGMASRIVTVEPPPQTADLSVTMTVQPDPVTVGETLTHTVTVHNAGPSAVTNVIVGTEVHTAQLTSAAPPAGCQTLKNDTQYVFRCTIASLAAGASTVLTTTVVPSIAETLTSRAVISGFDGATDPNVLDNSVTETTAVTAGQVGQLTGTIAFTSDRNGRRVYTKDLATGAIGAGLVSGSMPSWSPDGTRIAMVITQQLWTMAADGTDPQHVYSDLRVFNPVWSPDGREIAMTVLNGLLYDIVVVDLASGNVRPVVAGQGLNRYPAWSPDGSRILFSRDHASIRSVRASDGGDEQLHHTGTTRYTAWSPDGTRIAFSRLAVSGFSIRVLDLATGVESIVIDDGADNWEPTWSPDGTWLMFSKRQGLDVAGTSIWAIRPDGTGAILVESSGHGDSSPDWR